MLFLLAKLYEEYKRVDLWNPQERIVLYLTFISQGFFSTVFVPVWHILTRHIAINRIVFLLVFGGCIITIFTKGRKLIYGQLFKRKKMSILIDRYKNRSINRVVLYVLSVVIPFFLLFAGPLISVLLSGGTLFDIKIQGLLNL